ncbi:MAG: hypothetical protein ACRD4G_17980, partial [Bryobacteraceae bacterium]
AVLNQQTWLEVPNDLLQQAAGQRQDRTSGSTEGQISYQHLFSPSLVGAIRADIRDVSAGLWSNPLSTPVFAQQDRDYRETYWNGSLAGNNGPNNWKAGVQGRYASEAENFHYRIVAYTIGDEEIFDDTLPPAFQFNGRALDREHAAYGQDSLHLGALTQAMAVLGRQSIDHGKQALPPLQKGNLLFRRSIGGSTTIGKQFRSGEKPASCLNRRAALQAQIVGDAKEPASQVIARLLPPQMPEQRQKYLLNNLFAVVHG